LSSRSLTLLIKNSPIQFTNSCFQAITNFHSVSPSPEQQRAQRGQQLELHRAGAGSSQSGIPPGVPGQSLVQTGNDREQRGAEECRRVPVLPQRRQLGARARAARANALPTQLAADEQVGLRRAELAGERPLAHARHPRLLRRRQLAQELLPLRQVLKSRDCFIL